MRLRSLIRCLPFMGCCLLGGVCAGCAEGPSHSLSAVAMEKRASVALLPFGFDSGMTRLSAVKSGDETLSADEEVRQVAGVLQEIQAEARWLLLSRLATGHQFRFVSLEDSDALAAELGLSPGALPTAEHLAEFRRRLGADLVVAGTILDYGHIRWQWLVAGAFADVSAETIALGLATAWNPTLLLANVGVEILTNSAIFLGGGYVFGIAFRPVRVEARVFDSASGYPVWQRMEEAVYAKGDLQQLPESERGKKELQLRVNLARAMWEMAESLNAQGFTRTQLRTAPEVAHRMSETEMNRHED